MTLKDYMGPKKDWDREKWLQYAYVHLHNPWISDEDREYWEDKIKELRK